MKGELLNKAIALATEKHKNQRDLSGVPYILHPLRVMSSIKTKYGWDEELMCIAVLHDVIEDSNTTWEDLQKLDFTDRVIKGVRRLTKIQGESQEDYELKVLGSKDAMLVKLEDIRDNSDFDRLKDYSDKNIERLTKYVKFFMRIKKNLDSQLDKPD